MESLNKIVKKNLVISAQEALSFLPNRTALQRLHQSQKINHLGGGFYSSSECDELTALLAVVSKYYPHCIISGATALTLYELSDYCIDLIDVDILNTTNLKNSLLNVHRVASKRITGVSIKEFNGLEIMIYNLERSLIEAK